MMEPDIDNYEPEFAGGYAYAYAEVRHWLSSVDQGVPLLPGQILAQIEELGRPYCQPAE